MNERLLEFLFAVSLVVQVFTLIDHFWGTDRLTKRIMKRALEAGKCPICERPVTYVD